MSDFEPTPGAAILPDASMPVTSERPPSPFSNLLPEAHNPLASMEAKMAGEREKWTREADARARQYKTEQDQARLGRWSPLSERISNEIADSREPLQVIKAALADSLSLVGSVDDPADELRFVIGSMRGAIKNGIGARLRGQDPSINSLSADEYTDRVNDEWKKNYGQVHDYLIDVFTKTL